jgi:hypothetical protein
MRPASPQSESCSQLQKPLGSPAILTCPASSPSQAGQGPPHSELLVQTQVPKTHVRPASEPVRFPQSESE